MPHVRKPRPVGIADHDRILESVGIGVVTIDAAGTLLEVNDAAVTMFGHTRAAMLGRNVAMLMPPHHAEAHDGYLRRHLETGEERIIGRGRKVEGHRADGAHFPMHLAVGRFDIDGVAFFTGIVHDLSESERDHQNARRLARIVEESPNEICVFDIDTLRFTIVNRSAAANLGYGVEELLAMTPVDVNPLHDAVSFARLLEPLRSGELNRLRYQTVHERKDGSRYDVEITMHRSSSVLPPEYVAIAQDVTERNRLLAAVQQSRKMDAIGELTGGIAHDFNNLLTVIGGNLELLESMLDDAGSLELVGEAREAARMGAGLTSRLLSFARRSSLSPEPLDLNERVLGLAGLWRRSLGESISLSFVLAPELWPVRIDPSLADNALMNLAINARDAMAGHGELVIETANRTLDTGEATAFDLPPGDYVTLAVSDSGTGIKAADLARVFEPFFTTKGAQGGHGLGLSMVYGFARQSGGHVTVESPHGEGARFTLVLPRSAASPTPGATPASRSRPALGRRHLILVVEDDAAVRRLSARRLRHLGQDTLEAADGPSALAVIDTHPDIDLLFTDMVMPNGLSGLELARALRRHRPDLPVLIASGYSEELLMIDALREEGILRIEKPHDGAALADALEELLGSTPTAGD